LAGRLYVAGAVPRRCPHFYARPAKIIVIHGGEMTCGGEAQPRKFAARSFPTTNSRNSISSK
jgi:hypothetical protein